MLQLAHESLYKCRNVLNALVLLVAVVIFIRGGHSMSRPTSNDKQIRDRSASMHILYICTLIISSQSVFKQLNSILTKQTPRHICIYCVYSGLYGCSRLIMQFQKGSIKGGQEKSDTFSWTQT